MQRLTFATGSLPDLENRLTGKLLKFERSMEQWDIEQANIACAQADYYRERIRRLHETNAPRD